MKILCFLNMHDYRAIHDWTTQIPTPDNDLMLTKKLIFTCVKCTKLLTMEYTYSIRTAHD